MCTYVVSDSSVCSVFAYGAGGWGSIPNSVIFLITMALEAVKFSLFFNSLHSIILFFSFIHIRE
jgi:hypothetical protein